MFTENGFRERRTRTIQFTTYWSIERSIERASKRSIGDLIRFDRCQWHNILSMAVEGVEQITFARPWWHLSVSGIGNGHRQWRCQWLLDRTVAFIYPVASLGTSGATKKKQEEDLSLASMFFGEPLLLCRFPPPRAKKRHPTKKPQPKITEESLPSPRVL